MRFNNKKALHFLTYSILILLLCLPNLVAAKIINQVDQFDNQTYIFSQFKDTELRTIKPLSQLIFKKAYKTGENPKYLILITRKSIYGVAPYSFYNDFKIKFDHNTSKAFSLSCYAKNDNSLREIALAVPLNVIDMIMDNDSIEIEIPLYNGTAGNMELESIIYTVPIEVVREWRSVIKSE